ncbi:MAG: hypothetical protein ACYC0H_15980 [Solirubrobacteraceae bacterium]
MSQTVAVGDAAERNPLSSELSEQDRRLEEAFVHGWVTAARGPVSFGEDELARIDQVLDARDDPLPAAPAKREPFINGIADDVEFRIVTAGASPPRPP